MDTEPKKPGHRYNKPNNNPPEPTTADTAVSADEHQRTVTALERERGRRRSRPVLTVLLSLLLIGLGAAAALYVYTQLNADTDTKSQQTPTVEQQSSGPAMTATTAIESLPDGYEPYDRDVVMQPIKVAGYDHYTMVKASDAAATTVAGNESSVALATAGKNLKDIGFSEEVELTGADNTSYMASYASPDTICRISGNGTDNNPAGEYQVVVGCADMTDVSTTAKAQRPFADLVPTTSDDTSSTIGFVGTPEPKDSRTDGYQTAELNGGGVVDGRAGAGGAMYLFYRLPDGTWKFFTGAQNVLSCDRYNTDDLRKAYAGEPCGEGQRVSAP